MEIAHTLAPKQTSRKWLHLTLEHLNQKEKKLSRNIPRDGCNRTQWRAIGNAKGSSGDMTIRCSSGRNKNKGIT